MAAPNFTLRRNLLEAMELLRDAHPGLTLTQIVAFLHVADEDEAVPLPDLQHRADLAPLQAWRTARALAEDDAGGLVEISRWKSRNTLAVELSPAGRQLRTRLDAILKRAEPITSKAELAVS